MWKTRLQNAGHHEAFEMSLGKQHTNPIRSISFPAVSRQMPLESSQVEPEGSNPILLPAPSCGSQNYFNAPSLEVPFS